jgi:hypothetical protein
MEPRKILIVDDEDSMRHMLTLILAGDCEAHAVGQGSRRCAPGGEPFDSFSRCDHAGNGRTDLLQAIRKKSGHDHRDVSLQQLGTRQLRP